MARYLIAMLFLGIGILLALGASAALAKTGFAVYYSDKYQGRQTANGEIFDQKIFTAAHNELPYGTLVKVTNLENNHSVIVKINDRMAQNNPNIIDVSRRAAEKLRFIEQGRVSVTLETVKTRR